MKARLLILSFPLITLTPCLTHAQKKELGQARTILKAGKKPEDAEKLMTELLKDSANRDNKRIYATWYESVHMQYLAVNEKLYIKQKQDTARFFELTKRLFTIAETLDSLDMRPDQKGRVSPEYRKENAMRLNTYRPNLFFGGTYHVSKGDYKKAFEFCEAYIDCARQPLFAEYGLDTADVRRPEAAYWATYCGYRLKDPVLTLRHRHLAMSDTAHCALTLQYMAEARSWLKDDSLYMETLREGFRRYPTHLYFFTRLMDYYNTRNDYHEALAVADTALAANDSSLLFLFAKSGVLFNLQRFDECIALCNRIIALNDSMPEPYYYIGSAYMNKALKLNQLRAKKQVKTLYSKARPYMEQYRALAPKEKGKWGPALYRIYLNLNMGRQFDEIDQLLKQSNQSIFFYGKGNQITKRPEHSPSRQS